MVDLMFKYREKEKGWGNVVGDWAHVSMFLA